MTGCDCKWLGLLGVVPEERIAKPLYGLTTCTEGSNPSLSASSLIGRHLTIPTEQNP